MVRRLCKRKRHKTHSRHFSSRLPPSGGTCKYAKAPSIKKTWRDSLHIDMLLSAVSVLVVEQSSSEIPERRMNNPVYRLWQWRKLFSRASLITRRIGGNYGIQYLLRLVGRHQLSWDAWLQMCVNWKWGTVLRPGETLWRHIQEYVIFDLTASLPHEVKYV
jgi:hypothetical protein